MTQTGKWSSQLEAAGKSSGLEARMLRATKQTGIRIAARRDKTPTVQSEEPEKASYTAGQK